VGMMMLPAAAARFWSRSAAGQIGLAAALGAAAALLGLLVSYHADLPASPAIILVAGGAYVSSVVFGPHGGMMARTPRPRRASGALQ